MFIITARVPKKRLLVGAASLLCCAVVIIAALVITTGDRWVTASAEVSHIRSNDDRVAYLSSMGWQVSPQPVLTEELLIPDTFDSSYDDYLALQTGQGFDLTQYCGKRVKRYTYEVENHPSHAGTVQIVLLVYKNRVVGGQVQASDGILHGIAYPESTPSPAPAG